MKARSVYILLICIIFFNYSCSTTQKYLHDEASNKRQKELQECRSENIFTEVLMGIGTCVISAVTDTEIGYLPAAQQLKKIKLLNTTKDTLYVNMLSDLVWDKKSYCDFMDIRIPPQRKCTLLVPMNTSYNVYFSNTIRDDDDEMMTIFTTDTRTIALYPGLTNVNDSIKTTSL